MPAVRTFAVVGLLIMVPALAVAQASAPVASPANPPDPMNAAAPVPALPDIAPMDGYVPYQSPKVSPWRQSNANVMPGARPAAQPAADPHAGHRMQPAAASAPAAGHHAH